MKKIILSLAIIGVVGAIVGGATWAYFTGTATSEGNIFSVGELTILLGGRDNIGEGIYAPEAFFKVENMVPGSDCETAYIEIKNDGDMDMLFRVYARNASGNTGLLDYLDVTATLRPNEEEPFLGGSLYGPSGGLEVFSGPLRDIYGVDNVLDNEDAAFDTGWPLNSGYVAVYEVEVCLSFDTPNTLQGASMTADLRVDATQFDGQVKEDVKW